MEAVAWVAVLRCCTDDPFVPKQLGGVLDAGLVSSDLGQSSVGIRGCPQATVCVVTQLDTHRVAGWLAAAVQQPGFRRSLGRWLRRSVESGRRWPLAPWASAVALPSNEQCDAGRMAKASSTWNPAVEPGPVGSTALASPGSAPASSETRGHSSMFRAGARLLRNDWQRTPPGHARSRPSNASPHLLHRPHLLACGVPAPHAPVGSSSQLLQG